MLGIKSRKALAVQSVLNAPKRPTTVPLLFHLLAQVQIPPGTPREPSACRCCWRNLSKLRLPGLPAELARPPSKGSACRRAALQDAKLLTLLGRKNEAVSSFEKAFMAREGQMIYLKCDRVLVPWRSDPYFQALVKKLNFPE